MFINLASLPRLARGAPLTRTEPACCPRAARLAVLAGFLAAFAGAAFLAVFRPLAGFSVAGGRRPGRLFSVRICYVGIASIAEDLK